MLPSTKPRIEARPIEEPVKRQQDVPFQQRSIHIPNLALSGLQLIVGYAWLLAGVDKILLGTFPDQLSGLLRTTLSSGRLPGFFVVTLQGLVMPNSTLFGFLIEWGETLAGLGLMSAGLLALLRPLAMRSRSTTSVRLFAFGERLLGILALLAAVGTLLLGLSYFVLDGMPAPWFAPSVAYGGAIQSGLFLAGASVVLIAGQLAQRSQSQEWMLSRGLPKSPKEARA